MRLRRSSRTHTDAVDDSLATLVALSYELLDAHADTARLAADEGSGAEWDRQLAYLRDLQRAGREVLARAVSSRQDQLRPGLRSAVSLVTRR